MVNPCEVVKVDLKFELVVENREIPASVTSECELSLGKCDGDRLRLLRHDDCDIKFGVVQK